MAKYISYKIDENQNRCWFKLHSSDASKAWWNNLETNLNFITITDEEFNKVKYFYNFTINSSNQIVFDTDTQIPVEISQTDAEKGLEEHIAAMEYHVNNHETPLFTQSDISTLKNINLDNINWPVSTQVGSWVESLENNSITIDHIFEV